MHHVYHEPIRLNSHFCLKLLISYTRHAKGQERECANRMTQEVKLNNRRHCQLQLFCEGSIMHACETHNGLAWNK